MPITRTAMIDDDGSGTTGTILNNAWKQEFYNQIDALPAAGAEAWKGMSALAIQNDAFAALAGNFTVNRYRQLGGNTIVWVCTITGLVAPSPTTNFYLIGTPFTLLWSANSAAPIATAVAPGYVAAYNANAVAVRRTDGAQWPAQNQWLYFTITVEASGG
jgi:hypothetical protein